jgi:predicted dehydrogenase
LKPVRIGIVGVGKIARDQHVPALRANPAFELVACASRNARLEEVANFPSLEAMLDGVPDLDAISICTPPQYHYEATRLALSRGKHVFLEKPPCASTAQLDRLRILATEVKRTLFQTWHSRHAPSVDAAQRWLAQRAIRRIAIVWKEDVRYWHPGQTWIWEAGGFGVFDPGINALSILTKIVAEPIFVKSADLFVPQNCASPIAADIALVTDGGIEIDAAFDFRHTGVQTWDIDVETDGGSLKLSAGGAELFVDSKKVAPDGGVAPEGEYPSLYRRFAQLVGKGECDVDGRPFQLVADAFLVGKRITVEPFIE